MVSRPHSVCDSLSVAICCSDIMNEAFTCEVCGFRLWLPIAELNVSMLGLYSDRRFFPGRCLLALKEHAEHWEGLSHDLLHQFVDDSQIAIDAIRKATEVEHRESGDIGNTDPHVHFHLIPRYPESEPNPTKSPWNDPRKQEVLMTTDAARLRT